MGVTASAPGKLIVLGEYAVLEGAESLVWAVNRRVTVRLRAADSKGLVVEAPDIGVRRAEGDVGEFGTIEWRPPLAEEARSQLGMVSAAVAGAAQELGTGLSPNLHLTIDTSALASPERGAKLGVGSSAAVVTAVTGALLAFSGRDVEGDIGRRRVFDCVFRAHRRAQGNLGSGIDVAASVYGGALRYRVGETVEEATVQRVAPLLGLHWLAVWTGRAASTTSMVTAVQRFAREDPTAYGERLRELSGVSERGCDAYAAHDLPAFIEVARVYGEALARLGVAAGVDIVSLDHQRMGSIVRAEGGVYKPSGAGGGDLGIALAADSATWGGVEAALGRAGATTVPLALDEHGLRLEP